ncbi:hypothetical protein CMK15_14150 [Candidatus Poribacteria bacterium]|nr:hypothetical protein [Candidatus Poribacteria bacterium]
MPKEIEDFVLLPIPLEPKTNDIFELAGQKSKPNHCRFISRECIKKVIINESNFGGVEVQVDILNTEDDNRSSENPSKKPKMYDTVKLYGIAALEFLRSFDSKNGDTFKMYTEIREGFLKEFRKKVTKEVEERDIKRAKELEKYR